MIKRLLIVFITFSVSSSFAQQRGTASPYSFFGIGSFTFEGTAENRAMGGISFHTDSIHFNFRNPASYGGSNLFSSQNEEGRLVKFTVGGSSSNTNLSSDSGSFSTNATTFDYLGLSFPIGKLGIGLGLVPFTSVGYELEENNDNGDLANRFTGSGGVNRVFVGAGYQITKDLSVGVDLKYSFGDITNNAIEFLFDGQGNPLQTQSREINNSDLVGFSYNLGVTYTPKITENLQLSSAVTFTPESNLTSRNDRNLAIILVDPITGFESEGNQIDIDLDSLGLGETDFTLPSILSVGLGVGKPKKWFAGAEFTSTQTSRFTNRTFDIDNVSFEDSNKIALGGYYIPNFNSFSYFQRVVYRAGLNYETTGLIVNGESIEEFGISFGVGLPVGRFFSNANVSVELGQRGTTNQNLVREQFVNLQLSLSLNSRWFQRSKFR